jgi:hypothetical protein
VAAAADLVFEYDPPAATPTPDVALQAARLLGISALRRLRRLPVGVRRLLAGGAAGAVAKTATAPLEVVKLQLTQGGRLGAWGAARAIYGRAGAAGFFAGNALDVLRTTPSKAIELAAFDAASRALLAANHRLGGGAKAGGPAVPDGLVVGLAGAIAGVVSTVAVYPLETVRTRMAVGTAAGAAAGAAAGGGFVRMLAGVVRAEGVGALYRGLDASVIGIVPYAAIRFGVYDALKRARAAATGEERLPPREAALFGAVAGLASAVATFPLEVARRRMMVGARYPNVVAAVVEIAGKEGAGALLRGVGVSAAKQAPQYAIAFMAYEQAKRALNL